MELLDHAVGVRPKKKIILIFKNIEIIHLYSVNRKDIIISLSY